MAKSAIEVGNLVFRIFLKDRARKAKNCNKFAAKMH
jgi:hypothetical protein